MGERVSEILHVVFEVLTTAGLISVTLYFLYIGVNSMRVENTNTDTAVSDITKDDWATFDFEEVTGDQIYELANKYGSDMLLRVQSEFCPYGATPTFDEMKNPESSNYVDPAGEFIGHTIYSPTSGEPIGVNFVQTISQSAANSYSSLKQTYLTVLTAEHNASLATLSAEQDRFDDLTLYYRRQREVSLSDSELEKCIEYTQASAEEIRLNKLKTNLGLE